MRCKRGTGERWPYTEDITIEIERIITKTEEVEIERMLVDTRHPKKFEMMEDMLGY